LKKKSYEEKLEAIKKELMQKDMKISKLNKIIDQNRIDI